VIDPKAGGAFRFRLPLLGLIGLGGLIALVRARGRNARPTAAQLMRLDDVQFAEFIRRRGLRTISTRDGIAD
jgi:hypothetical protein